MSSSPFVTALRPLFHTVPFVSVGLVFCFVFKIFLSKKVSLETWNQFIKQWFSNSNTTREPVRNADTLPELRPKAADTSGAGLVTWVLTHPSWKNMGTFLRITLAERQAYRIMKV